MSDVRCTRCGEANSRGSAYCASCGLGLAAGAGVDGAPEGTSEAVSPPRFGETGEPVVTEPPASAPLTEQVPTPAYGVTVPNAERASSPEFAVASTSGSGRSNSVMIAALVVAIVVIVGGGLILVLSGGDDPQTGDSIAASEVTTVPASAAPTAETAPPTESAVDSTIATTNPATTPATTPATGLPPSPSTAAPVPPTSVAPLPGPIRGAGDLGLPQPILDEACDGRYITFVGSAIGDRPYADAVAELLARYPGSNYIWTKSCPSLRQVFRDGNDIYGVVFGPYATVGEACDARQAGPPDAYVRRISTTDPQDHVIDC